MLIISQFLLISNLGIAQLGSLLQGLSQTATDVSTRVGISSKGSTTEEFPHLQAHFFGFRHESTTFGLLEFFATIPHQQSNLASSELARERVSSKVVITLTTILYTHNHCFSLSAQYSINYMRWLTLYYEVGFVLGNFVLLYANVSILSMFKVGKVKL